MPLVGDYTREEYVNLAAGLAMGALVASEAELIANPGMRSDILKRSARLAHEAAELLWHELAGMFGHMEGSLGNTFAEHAARAMASLLGWWGANLSCQSGDTRDSGITNAVRAALESADVLEAQLKS